MAGLYDFNFYNRKEEKPLPNGRLQQTSNIPQSAAEQIAGLRQQLQDSNMVKYAGSNDPISLHDVKKQAWDSTIEKMPYHSMSRKVAGDKHYNKYMMGDPKIAPALADAKKTPPAVRSAVPRGLMLTPSQEKSYLAIQQSILDNPDDPKKWGQTGIVPRLTDNGTAMPNGWGAVKDSKGRVHIAPPTAWNFHGDTVAEEKWRDRYDKRVKNRELNQTLRDEAIKARSSFVSPIRRAAAADTMLGLESLQAGKVANSASGLNAALSREAALDKESRQRGFDFLKTLNDRVEKLTEKTGDEDIDKANAGKAARMMAEIENDPSLFMGLNTMSPAEQALRTGQIVTQADLNDRIKMQNDQRVGLRGVVSDWSIWNPSTWDWLGGRNRPYAGGELVNMDGYTPEYKQIIETEALVNKYKSDIQAGRITKEAALPMINAQLEELGLPPLKDYYALL